MNAWASSTYSNGYLPKYAWSGPGFFHSKEEDNPWLRVQLNEPTKITSITVGNRKDCCGHRLENLEIRAGMRNDLTNEIVGTFKGPGITGERYTIQLTRAVVAEYLTFQLKKKRAILHVQGIKLNKHLKQGKYKKICIRYNYIQLNQTLQVRKFLLENHKQNG